VSSGCEPIPAVATPRKRRRWGRVVVALVVVALLIDAFWYRQNHPEKWDENTWSDVPVEYKGGRTLRADPATAAAVFAQAGPGDMILLADGQYPSMTNLRLSGTKDKPTTVKAAGKGAVFSSLRVVYPQYLIIDGVGFTGRGIHVFSGAHVVLRNLRVAGDAMGVVLSDCSSTVLEASDVLTTGAGSNGVTLLGNCSRCVIRGNRLHDSPGGGLRLAAGYPTGKISLILVEGNRITGNAHGFPGGAVDCVDVTDSVFRNNLVINNGRGAIFRDSGGGFSFPGQSPVSTVGNYLIRLLFSRGCARDTFVNNTLHCFGDNGSPVPGFSLMGNCRGFRVHNNIFAGGPGGMIEVSEDSLRGLRMDNNAICNTRERGLFLFYVGNRGRELSPGEWRAKGLDRHSVISAELPFVSINNWDYRLRAGSPAIDAGCDLSRACPADIDGVKRPQGRGFDCGAYEYTPAPNEGLTK
jgi:hypothetical protein